MKKLPCYYENQIDNLVYHTIDLPTDILYNLGFTPNGVTTLSLITGAVSIYHFVQKNYWLSALFYFIAYYLDNIDGYMARRYRMISSFGDSYDHIRDLSINLILLYHIFLTYNKMNNVSIKIIILIILAVATFLLMYQVGCQEIWYNDNNKKDINHVESDSLADINICSAKNKEDAISYMRFTRNFGPGTFTLIICGIIIFTGVAEKINL